MTLEDFNGCASATADDVVRRCCGASRWVRAMVQGRPYATAETLFAAADAAWRDTGPADWREAFDHHPRIGTTQRGAAVAVDQTSRDWSAAEQSGVGETANAAFAAANREYEARFGHIYLVCAAGRSAADLLADLEQRMSNSPEQELRVAAAEQHRITRLRLTRTLGLSEVVTR